MLSPAEVERLAVNLAELGLDPVVYFSVCIAIGQALSDEAAHHAPGPNGAEPATRRGRRRLNHTPIVPLPAPDPPPPDNGDDYATHVLRGALASGPKPASDIEALAEKRGVGKHDLERAKRQLGVKAQRLDGRPDVCFVLPSRAPNAGGAPADAHQGSQQ
jgi:hypothetical protein